MLALRAFQTKNNLFGCLCLLVKNWLSLTTVACLLTVVATLSLCEKRRLSRLVLSYFVDSVFSTLLTWAKGSFGLWDVYLQAISKQPKKSLNGWMEITATTSNATVLTISN